MPKENKFTLVAGKEELPYSAENMDYLNTVYGGYEVYIGNKPAKEVMDKQIVEAKNKGDEEVGNEIKSTLIDMALTLIPGTTVIKLSKMSTPALRMLIAGVSDAAIDIGGQIAKNALTDKDLEDINYMQAGMAAGIGAGSRGLGKIQAEIKNQKLGDIYDIQSAKFDKVSKDQARNKNLRTIEKEELNVIPENQDLNFFVRENINSDTNKNLIYRRDKLNKQIKDETDPILKSRMGAELNELNFEIRNKRNLEKDPYRRLSDSEISELGGSTEGRKLSPSYNEESKVLANKQKEYQDYLRFKKMNQMMVDAKYPKTISNNETIALENQYNRLSRLPNNTQDIQSDEYIQNIIKGYGRNRN